MSTSEYSPPAPAAPRLSGTRALDRLRSVSVEGWIVFGLVVVAAVIRIVVIDNQSIWADEALTAFETRIPFGSMIRVVQHVETTPPLYFVVIWFWSHVFGTGVVALRSLSAVAGIALVPVAYLATRELAGRVAGVLAAAFVTFNPFLIWYSQEARTYMLLTLLAGLSFLWFARARREPSTRNLLWWAGWSALALMTHFFAAFLVAAEALWLIWAHRSRPVWLAAAGVAVVELAMLPFAISDTSHGAGWIASEPRHNRVSQAFSEWAVSIAYRHTKIWLGLVGGAVVIVAVVALTRFGGDRRTRDAVKVGGLIGGFVWVAPLALGYLGQDYFLSRNLMPAVVPFAVVLAAACVAPRARLLGGALAVALLALFVIGLIKVQTRPWFQRPDWRSVAHALGPATVPRAVLAADGTTADPLKIYLPGAAWGEPPSKRVTIDEVDVVGATKVLGVLVQHPTGSHALRTHTGHPVGRAVPARTAPSGTVEIRRLKVHNWVLARFALDRPLRVTISRLARLAARFFVRERAPRLLLVFYQRAQR